MATEPIETKDASEANNGSVAKNASAAQDQNDAKDSSNGKDANPPDNLSAAKDTSEDIFKQLAQLSAYQKQLAQLSAYKIEKYRLTVNEQELLLELLNAESLEPNRFINDADCVPFTLKDFHFSTGHNGQNFIYDELIEKVKKRIKLINEHNNRSAQMTFSCLYSKDPKSLETALLIIKYAHYNLVVHHNAKIALQMRQPEYYPKKFNKRFTSQDDNWEHAEFSYTAKTIFATLSQEISYTQLFHRDGPIAQLYHILNNKLADIKAKIRELPIKKKQDKKKFKQQIKNGTISIITTNSGYTSSIVNHDKLEQYAAALLKDSEENNQNKFARNNIANLINKLLENDNLKNPSGTARIIEKVQNRIAKLQYIISLCRPLSNLNKPRENNLAVASSREKPALNIFDNIINDAFVDINALKASIHFVLEKPALAVPARLPVRPSTPPSEFPDVVVTLSSPHKSLPLARNSFWNNLFTRSPSPEPKSDCDTNPAMTTAPKLGTDPELKLAPSSSNPPANPRARTLFPPAEKSAPSDNALTTQASATSPQIDKAEDPESCRICCFL